MKAMFSALAAALAIGVGVSASVRADSAAKGDAPGIHDGRGPGGPFAKLNLTDDQKSQLKALHEQHRDQMKATMQDLRDAHKDLHAAVFADNPDSSKIESLKAKITNLQRQMLDARVDHERKVAAILTPDQRKQMATMPPPGRGGWRHHRGHHPCGEDGPPPAPEDGSR